MKKSLSIILIAILMIGGILAVFPNTVYALNSASVSPTARTVTEGDTVSITVNMGQSISAATFDLRCSPSDVLTYVSVSKGLYNQNKFSYASVSDDTTSVTFTYRANKAGTATISVSGVRVSSGDEVRQPISISSSSSTITVNPKPTPTPTANPTPVPTERPQEPQPTRGPDRPNENDNPHVTDMPEEPTQTLTPTPTPDNNETNNNETNSVEQNTTNNETTSNETDNNNSEKAPNKIIKIDEEDVLTIKNEENDVMIKAKPIAIKDENVTLSVALIEEETERFNDLTKITEKIKGNKKFYDIKLLKDSLAIEPNGYVTVYLPIPEGYNKKRLEAYSINEQTEKYEKRTGEVQGNYYTFTTDKLEAFALVEKEAPSKTSRIITMILMLLGAIAILAIITIVVKKIH